MKLFSPVMNSTMLATITPKQETGKSIPLLQMLLAHFQLYFPMDDVSLSTHTSKATQSYLPLLTFLFFINLFHKWFLKYSVLKGLTPPFRATYPKNSFYIRDDIPERSFGIS